MKKLPDSEGGGWPIEQVIFSYTARIAAERDIDRLLLLLGDFGRDLTRADRCVVWVCDEKKGTLWSNLAHGSARIQIPRTKGLAGRAATHGEALMVNDPARDPRFDRESDRQTGYRTRSILVIPILEADGRVSGVFQAVNKRGSSQGFSEVDEERLLIAATYAAEILTTAQMQAEIETAERELVDRITTLGKMRSREMGRRARRMAAYCRLLGVKRGLPESECGVLCSAAPMFDIGNVAIPDSILLKPCELTPDERAVVQTHTTLGRRILGSAKRGLLQAAAIIAGQHHERWDGTGYPSGLAGEQIHLYGRICAVADVFDALASDRPYRNPWDLHQIVTYFRDQTGKHFDPDLSRIFLEHVDEFLKIRRRDLDTPEGG